MLYQQYCMLQNHPAWPMMWLMSGSIGLGDVRLLPTPRGNTDGQQRKKTTELVRHGGDRLADSWLRAIAVAQSPLAVQPFTGRVRIGNSNTREVLDVSRTFGSCVQG